MFYIYFFIFFGKNIFHHETHQSSSCFMIDSKKKGLLSSLKDTDVKMNNYSLELKKSYVFNDGFDTRFNITFDDKEILNFIYNKKKLYIYHLLLSNTTSLPTKIYLADCLNDFSLKNKYTPSLFSGGFFKDSDFLF